jgi:hypothetical protein
MDCHLGNADISGDLFMYTYVLIASLKIPIRIYLVPFTLCFFLLKYIYSKYYEGCSNTLWIFILFSPFS